MLHYFFDIIIIASENVFVLWALGHHQLNHHFLSTLFCRCQGAVIVNDCNNILFCFIILVMQGVYFTLKSKEQQRGIQDFNSCVIL